MTQNAMDSRPAALATCALVDADGNPAAAAA